MSISSWVYIRTLALGTVLIAHVIPYAADSFARCDPAIEAAQYDRKADEYDEAAERYRAWALADDMFATDRYGITWELAQQAARFEVAARQSRLRAAALRDRGHSDPTSCIDEPSAGARTSRGEQ